MSISSHNATLAWSILKKSQKKKKIHLLNCDTPISNDFIRFVAISDTHNKHDKFSIPNCDVLLHCGDFTFNGFKRSQIESFDKYLGTLPNYKKIVISGNHDWDMYKVNKNSYQFQNCEYLQDSGTTVFGYKIYGTPWIPHYHRGAFMLNRGDELREKWQLIPNNTDILLSHGPPVGYGDKTKGNNNAGDVDLLLEIQNRVKPIMHIFGHIHEGYGTWTDETTTYVNASICDIHYRPINKPIVFDLPILENHFKNS